MEACAETILNGTILVIAPHMDDEVLACGGTIAQLPHKERVHVIFATDGARAVEPVIPWRDTIAPDLPAIRADEARRALGALGVPAANIHFLDLPDGKLGKYSSALDAALTEVIQRLAPAWILIPFRFDRHPDHLAVNRAITRGVRQGAFESSILEYFVYYRWRLLLDRDIRRYIRPEHLIVVPIEDQALRKRAALDCYVSQTTCWYAWQDRPILTQTSLDEVCRNPEYFLRFDPASPGPSVFARAGLWISIVHRLEPMLKKRRDRFRAMLKRGTGRSSSHAG